jgi:hypothetical protein
MQSLHLQQTATALQNEWGISLSNHISEEEILKQLALRIAQLIEQDLDAFVQLMYRLDISEKKLHGVMGEEYVAEKIARLIYDRQLQKIHSRARYSQKPSSEDSDLQW